MESCYPICVITLHYINNLKRQNAAVKLIEVMFIHTIFLNNKLFF